MYTDYNLLTIICKLTFFEQLFFGKVLQNQTKYRLRDQQFNIIYIMRKM